ncbi:hypothetical protein PR048_019389 [Dryococelus australis]|uniref:Uncharacterized protein n=1 Tax=Dryococelus australis TaxID=614101 RepID=A0ABQ9H3D4_9NEOP|nr:hypothetical protein PR048_019389 [Dryococelus australis]
MTAGSALSIAIHARFTRPQYGPYVMSYALQIALLAGGHKDEGTAAFISTAACRSSPLNMAFLSQALNSPTNFCTQYKTKSPVHVCLCIRLRLRNYLMNFDTVSTIILRISSGRFRHSSLGIRPDLAGRVLEMQTNSSDRSSEARRKGLSQSGAPRANSSELPSRFRRFSPPGFPHLACISPTTQLRKLPSFSFLSQESHKREWIGTHDATDYGPFLLSASSLLYSPILCETFVAGSTLLREVGQLALAPNFAEVQGEDSSVSWVFQTSDEREYEIPLTFAHDSTFSAVKNFLPQLKDIKEYPLSRFRYSESDGVLILLRLSLSLSDFERPTGRIINLCRWVVANGKTPSTAASKSGPRGLLVLSRRCRSGGWIKDGREPPLSQSYIISTPASISFPRERCFPKQLGSPGEVARLCALAWPAPATVDSDSEDKISYNESEIDPVCDETASNDSTVDDLLLVRQAFYASVMCMWEKELAQIHVKD